MTIDLSKLKRYDPDYHKAHYCGSCPICMIERMDGEFIRYEDLMKLIDEKEDNS